MIDSYIYLHNKVPRRGECLTDPLYNGHKDPPKSGDYGGFSRTFDYVKLDCDDIETFETLISMCREKGLKFNAVETTRGGHVYFKNTGLTKNRKAQEAENGLVLEWKFSSSNDFVPIKRGGVMLEWVEGSPTNKDIDVLPAWLFPKAENNIPSGTRNEELFRLGCSLRAKGATYEEIRAAVSAANIERCKPPLSNGDIEIICKQAAKYEQGGKFDVPDFSAHSVSDLQRKTLSPLRWIVAEMLPQGLSLLASPPKYGKSWFVLDLCLSVAAGDSFLKHRTTKSGCLYLALEDSEHRLKDRVNKLTLGQFAPEAFFYTITAQTLDTGLIEQLERFLSLHPNTALIVIDTLQKVRGATHSKETGYASDYRETGALKSFADKHGISILVVHHLRKMKDDDPFNQISGTQGILGAVDTAMVLTKKSRTDEDATLSITGRDVQENQIVLGFDKQNYRWKVKGTVDEIEERRLTDEYENDPVVQTVKHLIEQSSEGWTGTMSELHTACVEFTGVYPTNRPNELGKKILPLAKMLSLRDRIRCEFPDPNGGKKGRKYRFYKEE